MQRSVIRRAVAAAGLSLPDDLDYDVVGDEPVLRSPHHLATGAATARLLTGAAASELWRLRTGRTQQLRVDAAHAAVALSSFVYLGFDDPAKRPPLQSRVNLALVSIVPCADGRYVQLHSSFDDSEAVLEILGVPADASREEIVAVTRRWDAFALQQAFIDRRLCGGVVMSRAEWAAHPQGQALAGLPIVRITQIGSAEPQPLPEGDRPLSKVRVLDWTRVLAGPTCAKTLAEHGADVLHVSSPHLTNSPLFDADTGTGKRQASLHMPDDGDVVRELAAGADVFSQGYRRGALGRLGLGPTDLARLRPGIVYVSENCYGPVGPWADRPGWEQLGQAATGMSFREGEARGAEPQLAPAAVNDYSTGFLAAYGAMEALRRRATEGGSWHVEVSLSQTCNWYQDLGDDNPWQDAPEIDPSPYMGTMDSPEFGTIRYVTPALSMSETPPRWDLPPVGGGAHDPVWLPR